MSEPQPVAAHLPEQLLVELLELLVAGRLEQRRVERGVRLEEGGDVLPARRGIHPCVQRLELAPACSAVSARDGELDRHALDRLAHLVELEELRLRERGNNGAATRPDGDEPFGGEPPDRLADRAAADAELIGERDLGELCARLEAALEDLLRRCP